MTSPRMMRMEEQLGEHTHRFDREQFAENMLSFSQRFGGASDRSDDNISLGGGNKDDSSEILSLDDSNAESETRPARKVLSKSYSGALEKTLKLSPMKRSKTPAAAPKSPPSRKGLGLARFLKAQSQNSSGGDKEGNMLDLEPIWKQSDIMSVAAASKAAIFHDAGDAKSVSSFHPSSGNSVATGNHLWDVATKKITTTRSQSQRSLSLGPQKFLEATLAHDGSQQLKRSHSQNDTESSAHNVAGKVPGTPRKSPRRKLKKEPKGSMSLTDASSRKAPSKSVSPLVAASTKDTKSRLRLPSKASHDSLNRDDFIGIAMVSPTTPDEIAESPKETKKTVKKQTREGNRESEKDKKPDDTKRSDSVVVVANLDVLLSKPFSNEEDHKKLEKKKRSKSLNRVSLYEHESSEIVMRDPHKRRGSKREHRGSHPGDCRSNSSSPKPIRSSSLGMAHKRMSRRQLLKKMDSESVISAPSGISSMSKGRSSPRSPRSGRNSKKLPRRGDARRNLLSASLHLPNSSHHASPRDVVEERRSEDVTTTERSSLNNSRRSMQSSSTSGVSSAKTHRRRLSDDPDERAALMKRIESVNSFFGHGLGEIGSAYPSTRSPLLESDNNEDSPKKPESFPRRGKRPDKMLPRQQSK